MFAGEVWYTFSRWSIPDERRSLQGRMAGGKSGHHRVGCWLTASRRESEDSATENKPPTKGKPEVGQGEKVR
jgi:hypothetical protein